MRSAYPSTVCGNSTTSPSVAPAPGAAGAAENVIVPAARSSVKSVTSSPQTQARTAPVASISPSSVNVMLSPSV